MAPLRPLFQLKRWCLFSALILTIIPIVLILINPRFAHHPLTDLLTIGVVLSAVSCGLYFKQLLKGLTGQNLRQAMSLFVYMALVLAIAVVVYMLALRFNHQWDITKSKLNSLSEQTLSTLAHLKEPIEMVCFIQSDDQSKPAVQALLDQYVLHAKGKLKYEIVDPDRNPTKAESYKLEKYGTIFVQSEKRREKIEQVSENDFTNAILKVFQNKQRTVVFLKGHGETSLDDPSPSGLSLFKAALEQDNLTIKELELFRESEISSDVQCVIVGRTKNELFESELKVLDQYLEKGGSVLVLAGPDTNLPLKNWLAQKGIKLGEDRVVDKLSRLVGQDPTSPLVTQYGDHPITQNFQLASMIPVVRSIRLDEPLPHNEMGVVLALSSPQSWAETNLVQLEKGEINLDATDTKGPVALAVAVEALVKSEAEKEKTSKLVVFGSSRFVENRFIPFSGNKDFLLNSVQWMCGDSDLITVRPKTIEQSALILSAAQQRFVFFVPVIIMPLAAILIGVAVKIKRRMLA